MEDHDLSQKLSQLSTSHQNQEKVTKIEKQTVEKPVPDYLLKANKSFEKLIYPLLPKTTTTSNIVEDLRQVAILIHQIMSSHILHSLWTTYLKSGMGELKGQQQLTQASVLFWPLKVKSMVTKDIRAGTNEHDACMTFVQKRLSELEENMKQYRTELNVRESRLHGYTQAIRRAIETFVQQGVDSLQRDIEHKIVLVQFDYNDRVLELEYLHHNPNEDQVRLWEFLIVHLDICFSLVRYN
jgi:hypothetical protein